MFLGFNRKHGFLSKTILEIAVFLVELQHQLIS